MRTFVNLMAAAYIAVLGFVFTAVAVQAEESTTKIGIGAGFMPWTENTSLEPNDPGTIVFVYVDALVCDGPAMKAGLERGDLIKAFNGEKVEGVTPDQFAALVEKHLRNHSDGEKVTITVDRRSSDSDPKNEFDLEVIMGVIPLEAGKC